jgi:hypothetical protein
MAISRGNTVLASSFNQLAGSIPSNRAFPDANSAQRRMNALFGVGWGDRGYGQSSNIINAIQPNHLIAASDWIGLRQSIFICSNFLGLNIPSLPNESLFSSGTLITPTGFDWASAISQIDTARMSPNPSNLSTSVAITDSRTTNWLNNPIFSVEVNFGTEDAARWFFNSGGKISLSSTFVPASSTPRNTSWFNLIASLGTIQFGATNTVRLGGSSGQGVLYGSNGYYGLGSSTEDLFFIQPDSGNFQSTNVIITVQRGSRSGINGGNGSRLIFSIFYNDTSNDPFDTVSGNLAVSLSTTRPNSWITIAQPVSRILQNLDDSLSFAYFEFQDQISTNVNNYNLGTRLSEAAANSTPPVDLSTTPVIATVVVTESGIVGSSSTQQPGLLIPSLLSGSFVRLINNGIVVGAGGQGGEGWSWWTPPRPNGENGGTAVSLNYPTTLINQGIIGGGGGGGGGSSTRLSNQTYDDPGGSGGGGAGSVAGAAGLAGPQTSYLGSPGTLFEGGAGGFPSPGGADAARRSREWANGFDGGNGGNLGQPGTDGQGDYGFGFGGFAGIAISGNAFVISGSTLGDVRGQIS